MNTLNEGQTQVYMNGAVTPQYGVDVNAAYLNRPPKQLLDLIQAFAASGKSEPQILAILVGMGTQQQMALSGINYFKALNAMNMKNENQNNHIKMKFTLTDLYENISKALGELKEMNSDASKVSISAKQASIVLESALASFPGIKLKNGNIITRFDEAAYHQLKEDVEQNGGPFSGLVMFKEFNQEEFDKLKEAFEAQLNPTVKYSIAKNLYNEMARHDWLNPIRELKSYLDHVYSNSKISFKISESINSFGSKGNPLYEKLSNELISALNESDVESALRNVANKNKWSLECQGLVAELNESKNIANGSRSARIEKILTPVIEGADGIVFNLHGKNYIMNENKIEETTVNDFRYLTILDALSMAKVQENAITFYGQNDSFLEYSLTEGTLKLGEIDLTESNVSELRNAMISTKFYDARNINQVDKICIMFENIDMLTEMDQALALTSNEWLGLYLTLIAVEEGVWVNKVNTGMKLNEMKFFESASDALSETKDFIGYDASTYLSERLQSEGNAKAIAEELRSTLNSQISTLEEKRNDVLAAVKEYGECEELSEALSIIENEISSLEQKVQATYTISEKKTLQQYLDDGYVESKLEKDINPRFKKGMQIMINAEEYASLGDNDLIDVINPKNDDNVLVPKKDLSVKL
jgi:hypothetical protein